MESQRLDHRTTARATALALALVGLCLAFADLTPASARTAAAPVRQGGEPICTFDFSCGCEVNCHDSGPGGGTPGNPPPTEPPGGGSDPLPPGDDDDGAGGGGNPNDSGDGDDGGNQGYYFTVCLLGEGGAYGCIGSTAKVTFYVDSAGNSSVVSAHCVSPNACRSNTPPTPEPPVVVDPYPCQREPVFGGDVVSQPCENGPTEWPGWDLSVSVKIPAVWEKRYPWPRSIVDGQTTICFAGGPDNAEAFSANKARVCNTDGGEHDEASFDCGTAAGEVGEGARVNFKLGVAWRRYTGALNPFDAPAPSVPSALVIADRDFNGGTTLIPVSPGQCTSKTWQTSSWGLAETFPPWNAECQDRECAYTERTDDVSYTCEACDNCACDGCVPAYATPIQTWWWPEWTWKYEEYQCVRKDWSECFWWQETNANGQPRPAPAGYAACGSGPHAGEENWYEEQVCVAWGWREVTDPWRQYDIRKQGLPGPFWRSARTATAGMDENRIVRTGFDYPPSVPVIEEQPVAP